MSASQQKLTPLIFDGDDATPHCEPVQIGLTKYWLHEASEGDAVVFSSARARSARMVDGKVVGVDNIGEISPLLVSLCLFRAAADGTFPRLSDGSPDLKSRVPVAEVKRLPARIVRQLFDRALLVSELKDAEEETEEDLEKKIRELQSKLFKMRTGKSAGDPAKNEPDGTTE